MELKVSASSRIGAVGITYNEKKVVGLVCIFGTISVGAVSLKLMPWMCLQKLDRKKMRHFIIRYN